MAPTMLEPNLIIPAAPPLPLRNILVGTMDAQLIDQGTGAPTFVFDRTVANGVNADWQLSGLMAPYYTTDTFNLTVYLEEATGGPNLSFTSGPIAGATGVAAGSGYSASLSFPAPATPPNPPRIVIPANSVAAGVYRTTVLLSHTPAVANQRIAGFVDLGMVEFFQP